MHIGAAKPTAAERAAVPHHLIDLLLPTEAYSAARFRADALKVIAEVHARGRTPLLAGGTMLYFKVLRDGLSTLPRGDAALRIQIDAEAARVGWPALHAELARSDPTTAARLAPTDSQRIQRALEIIRLTGEPMSALLARSTSQPLPFQLTQFALVPSDRGALHVRISERFAAMLEAGLIDEVRSLRQKYAALDANHSSMRSVGYRQAWEHLDGAYDAAELLNRGIFATRQLAKRQLTWLRTWPDTKTIDPLVPHYERAAIELITQATENRGIGAGAPI